MVFLERGWEGGYILSLPPSRTPRFSNAAIIVTKGEPHLPMEATGILCAESKVTPMESVRKSLVSLTPAARSVTDTQVKFEMVTVTAALA